MVVDDKFLQEGLFDKLGQIVASCHLINVDNSLN